MSKISSYFREIRGEFSQITWPTRAMAVRLAITVVIFSAAFALFLGGIDYVFGEGVRKILTP